MLVLTFGEIMARVSPRGNLQLRQALPGRVNLTFGGAEANVAVSLAQLGTSARFLTSLPDNAVAHALLANLRGLGVDVGHIHLAASGRLGIYFLETGANQRPSKVIYDREGSSISLTPPEGYDFDKALEGVQWLHFTGITPSLSENAYKSCLALAGKTKENGVSVSCDLNFRKKLWKWKPGTGASELAKECMSALLPSVDVVIANEEDAANVLGISAEGTSVQSGKLNAEAYEDVAKAIVKAFPNVKRVAITLRESISASHNNWGGMLFDAAAGKACFAPLDEDGSYAPYQVTNIVDRVGAGDAFGAGLIHALNSEDYSASQAALRFAVAASCLKHSISGDFNYVTRDEVESLMRGGKSGRIQR